MRYIFQSTALFRVKRARKQQRFPCPEQKKISGLERRRLKDLDERGCRIIVEDPPLYDELVINMHRRMSQIALGAQLGRILKVPGDKGTQKGYLRLYNYGAEGPIGEGEKLLWN